MATTINFSDSDIQSLANEIRQAYAVGPAPAGGAAAPANVLNDFCKVWKDVDTGLTALEAIVGAIPGWGLIAKGAIAIVVAAGEAANKALCPAAGATPAGGR